MKKLILFSFLLTFLALGVVYAFDKANYKKTSARQNITWYYNSSNTSLTAMKNAANWQQTQSEDYTCGGSDAIPCSVTIPEETDLSVHLSQFNTVSDLVDEAGSRQTAP